MSEAADRVKMIVEAHHGVIVSQHRGTLTFTIPAMFITSALAQFGQQHPKLIGQQVHYMPPRRLVGDKWVEVQLPCAPGHKPQNEPVAFYLYTLKLPKRRKG